MNLLAIARGSSVRNGIELHATQRNTSWWRDSYTRNGDWVELDVPRQRWPRPREACTAEDEKAKERAKALDEKLVKDMTEEHAVKLREMHAKVTDTQSAATSKLQQRLAQRKQGGKVAPAPMEGVTVDVFPK